MDGGRVAAGGGDPSPVAAPPHPTAASNTPVDVSSFTHTPFYCEENVYMLCKELIRIGVADPLGTDLRNKGEVLDLVWDLDSDLPFPSSFIQYVSDAIQPLAFGDSIYRRLFRVVHAPLFLRSFASDRSHMKDPAGNWIQLPPKYDPIVAADGTTNNLNEYITMSVEDVADLERMVNDIYSKEHGVVVNETVLPIFFSRLPGSHP